MNKLDDPAAFREGNAAKVGNNEFVVLMVLSSGYISQFSSPFVGKSIEVHYHHLECVACPGFD